MSINLEAERTFTILNNVLMSSVDNHTMITVVGAITVSKISIVNYERVCDNKKNMIYLTSFQIFRSASTYKTTYLSSVLSTQTLSPRTVVFIANTGFPYWYHSPVQLDGNSQDPESKGAFH